MGSVIGIFHRSIHDLVRWVVLKEVLITGIPLMFIWLGIGYLFWNKLLTISTTIISWVPFSIIKANGAMLILFLIWALAVLVSYAVVVAIVGPIFFKKMQKSYYYLSFSLLILFSTLWGWTIIFNWHILKTSIADRLLIWLPFQTVAEGSAILLNFYIFYSLYILSLFLVLSIYRKAFLETIKEIEYPDIELNFDKVKTFNGLIALRDSIIFIVLTIVLFPLLMIPIINVLIQIFLWAWLYRDVDFRGTCKLFCTEDEFKKMYQHKFTIWSIAFTGSLLNFIPIINIFTPFFTQLMTFHWIMGEKLSQKQHS